MTSGFALILIHFQPILRSDSTFLYLGDDSFQIIRLRTDLLAPLNDIGLTQETTDLTLSEVNFLTWQRRCGSPAT